MVRKATLGRRPNGPTQHQRSNRLCHSKRLLNGSIALLPFRFWLYMTVNSQGGSTVLTIYRYYLSGEIAGKDTDIIQQLAMKHPVIEGTGTVTAASMDTNGEVKINYSGKVISIESNISSLRFSVKP
jgi:hypothetical protein